QTGDLFGVFVAPAAGEGERALVALAQLGASGRGTHEHLAHVFFLAERERNPAPVDALPTAALRGRRVRQSPALVLDRVAARPKRDQATLRRNLELDVAHPAWRSGTYHTPTGMPLSCSRRVRMYCTVRFSHAVNLLPRAVFQRA